MGGACRRRSSRCTSGPAGGRSRRSPAACGSATRAPSASIDRLEADGLARRARDPADGRSVLVAPHAGGRRRGARVLAARARRRSRRALAPLAAAERRRARAARRAGARRADDEPARRTGRSAGCATRTPAATTRPLPRHAGAADGRRVSRALTRRLSPAAAAARRRRRPRRAAPCHERAGGGRVASSTSRSRVAGSGCDLLGRRWSARERRSGSCAGTLRTYHVACAGSNACLAASAFAVSRQRAAQRLVELGMREARSRARGARSGTARWPSTTMSAISP